MKTSTIIIIVALMGAGLVVALLWYKQYEEQQAVKQGIATVATIAALL